MKKTPKAVKSLSDLPTKPNRALKKAFKRYKKSVKAVSSKAKRASPVTDKKAITENVRAAVLKVAPRFFRSDGYGMVTINELEKALGRSRNTTVRWVAIAKLKWRRANDNEIRKIREPVKVGRLPLVLAA